MDGTIVVLHTAMESNGGGRLISIGRLGWVRIKKRNEDIRVRVYMHFVLWKWVWV